MSSSHIAVKLSSLLRNCAPLSALHPGKQVHAQALALGLLPHATLETDLLLLYSRCSRFDLARQVFDGIPHRSMHSWNILLSSYAQNSLHSHALALLRPFLESGLRPDHFTLPALLKACAGASDCFLGMTIHAWAVTLGLEEQLVVGGSILDFYVKCGSLGDACKLFELIPKKDVVIWNSMISGFARAGRSVQAMSLFRRLQCEGLEFDWRAIPSIFGACGREGDLVKGKEIHGRVVRFFVFDSDVGIGNSLIDMYAKCGCLDAAHKVSISMRGRNLVTWSTLISAYGVHGKGEEALRIYNEMVSRGFIPNCITFTSVLSSCSHAGLIEEGRRIFESMSKVHSVEPSVEHYACMVDLLGRFGSISEALKLIHEMPMVPVASVWGALLSACVVHKNVEVGEIAAEELFILEAGNASNYIALCSIYEAVGRWDGVAKMRQRMRELGMVKTAGCSWIDAKGRFHAFCQGDNFNLVKNRIHEVLDQLAKTTAF